MLTSVVGLVLAFSGFRQRPSTEATLLAVGSALGFAAVEISYTTRRRISKIYLLDAVLQLALVAAHLVTSRAAMGDDETRGARETITLAVIAR